MNGKCFEIGRIQAFLDGELTPDLSARFTNHVADCDACAALLARAEEEMSIVFPGARQGVQYARADPASMDPDK